MLTELQPDNRVKNSVHIKHRPDIVLEIRHT